MDRVTILVTTMLRPGYLRACLAGIRSHLPECKVVVVDNGDCGVTVKRNTGVKLTETPYVLLGSDDFNFGTTEVREGVQRLLDVLDSHPEIDIASGRHNNIPYEGFLRVEPGKYIKETRLAPNGEPFQKCDITVNYFLARTSVLREVPWDETIVPIGGEHGDFFLSLKEAGKTVVYVPGVNIDALPNSLWLENDPHYAAMRGRAASTGHKIFLAKRGVTNYFGFDEEPCAS